MPSKLKSRSNTAARRCPKAVDSGQSLDSPSRRTSWAEPDRRRANAKLTMLRSFAPVPAKIMSGEYGNHSIFSPNTAFAVHLFDFRFNQGLP